MGYNNYRIQIILKLTILLLFLCLLAILISLYEFIKAAFILPILIYLIYDLFNYINKTNKDFSDFLSSLAHKDYTINYNDPHKGKSFANLYHNFDKISDQFKTLNFDRELQFQHLQRLVKHIDVGMISFDKNDNIHLVNQSFKELFNLMYLDQNQNIDKLPTDFIELIKSMNHGENRLYKPIKNSQSKELSIHCSTYQFKSYQYQLISVKNIHRELDYKEQESFQKLISVLTHEIMNSVSPIVSLSSTLETQLNNANKEEVQQTLVKEAIHAIHDRSKNLLNFTHEYRKLTKLPQPKIIEIDITKFLNRMITLYKEELKASKIRISLEISQDTLLLNADEHLLEQALINLLKNAVEALENSENGEINIQTFITQDHEYCIRIQDNGKGISYEKLNKVLIPFYTDKEKGSGIGLNLCKQIMRSHHGSIHIDSKENEFTVINLCFPIKND